MRRHGQLLRGRGSCKRWAAIPCMLGAHFILAHIRCPAFTCLDLHAIMQRVLLHGTLPHTFAVCAWCVVLLQLAEEQELEKQAAVQAAERYR